MRGLQAARGASLNRRQYAISALAVGIALFGVALDQITKIVALRELEPGISIPVIGQWFQLTLIRNSGAAFSLGSSATVALSIFACIALLACLVVGLPRVKRASHAVALGLLMAGIAGNLYDRLFREPGPFRGHVIDFFQVEHFAIFNVADIWITTAAGLIILLSFAQDRRAAAASE